MNNLSYPVTPREPRKCNAKLAGQGSGLSNKGKTDLFNQVREVRTKLGVSRTALSLLWALISFPKSEIIQPQADGRHVVFASVDLLASRINSSRSTVQRATRNLVAAGLVEERLSPNKRRFARRDRSQDVTVAYGIDIMPFIRSEDRIEECVAEVRANDDRITALKDTIRERIYQLTEVHKLPAPLTAALNRLMRRKTTVQELEAALETLSPAQKMTDIDSQSDRHKEHINRTSNKRPKSSTSHQDPIVVKDLENSFPQLMTKLRRARTEAEITHVLEICALSIGIPKQTWSTSIAQHGREAPMIILAKMMEKSDAIRAPRNYFSRMLQLISSHQATLSDLISKRKPRAWT